MISCLKEVAHIFPCSYLNGNIEITEERAKHIAESHPELLPKHMSLFAETLSKPDQIRKSVSDDKAKLFSRWYSDFMEGRHVVVVVICEADRNWIITAYTTKKLVKGEIEWKQN